MREKREKRESELVEREKKTGVWARRTWAHRREKRRENVEKRGERRLCLKIYVFIYFFFFKCLRLISVLFLNLLVFLINEKGIVNLLRTLKIDSKVFKNDCQNIKISKIIKDTEY